MCVYEKPNRAGCPLIKLCDTWKNKKAQKPQNLQLGSRGRPATTQAGEQESVCRDKRTGEGANGRACAQPGERADTRPTIRPNEQRTRQPETDHRRMADHMTCTTTTVCSFVRLRGDQQRDRTAPPICNALNACSQLSDSQSCSNSGGSTSKTIIYAGGHF